MSNNDSQQQTQNNEQAQVRNQTGEQTAATPPGGGDGGARKKSRQQLLAERITFASQRSITIQVILVLSAFAGLCSSIFPILKSFNVSDAAAYIVTAAAIVVVGILLLAFLFVEAWKAYLVRATIALLFTISLGLCGLLYWKYFIAIDEWVAWQSKVSESAAQCEKSFKEAQAKEETPANFDAKVTCVGRVIKEKYPHGTEEPKFKIESLNNDVRAGAFMMKDEIIVKVLETKIGIGEKFLGTGFAVPSNGKDYGDARLPEYLAPNLPETSDKVLTWQIKPVLANTSQTIECMIIGCGKDGEEIEPTRPSNIGPGDEQKYQVITDYIKNPANRADENKVILIRLSQFSAEKYSKRMGRPAASRVFMIRLRDVWGMAIKDAITYSGHKVDENKADETLFIWVYAPTAEGAIMQATWKNILSNIDSLLK